MNKITTDVCIVGSGPAGALLGLLLAKNGHKVTLLERFSHFNREYRGEILQPSTLKMLNDIGLLEYILEQPHNRIEKGGIYSSGKRIMNFTMGDLSEEYPYAIQMAQATFIEALLAEAKKYPNFSILMNAHVKDLLKDEDNKVIGVKGMIEKEPTEIVAEITVGSDGRNSTLRNMSSFEITNEHHRSNLIWFTVDWPSHLPYDLMYMLTG
jgi:2-polyprenyl-6-methoxyphenol hydroxylase-like FAD-dependent oxidoreductase